MRPFKLYGAPPVAIELKYGGKKETAAGKSYPVLWDHFQVVSRVKGELNFNRLDDVHQLIGERPTVVPVRLLSDDIKENFSLFRGIFDQQGKLWCGAPYGEEKATRKFKGSGNNITPVDRYEVDCGEECEFWKNEKCNISGSLYFRLPESFPHSGALGICRINGANAQRRIIASLEILTRQTNGFLANLPLQIRFHSEKKRSADGKFFPIPMLSIEPGENFFEALELELQRREKIADRLGDEHRSLKIKNVLLDVHSRKATFDEGLDQDDIMAEQEDSVEDELSSLIVYPDDIGELLAKLPAKAAEIACLRFGEDVEGLREFLIKEGDKDDFEF